MKLFRYVIGPTLLIVCCPIVAILFWYTATHLDGSLSLLFNLFQKNGFFSSISSIWGPIFFGSKIAWLSIGVFSIFQLTLMKVLPGKIVTGPETKTGFIPTYKANGPLALFVTLLTFLVCSYGLRLFSPTIIYDHFGEILSSLCLSSLLFCLFLDYKGRKFPSSKDRSTSGNPILDYYWGTELYPRILGWDVKQFTNCRFGMMSWPIIILSFAAKQHELYGLSNTMIISVLLQMIYVTKFFFWEKGYLRSIDIMHDRAGFYICWGCLVWVPAIYTSPAHYLVHHPIELSFPLAFLIFTTGTCAIMMNYLADRQRVEFRESQGTNSVWGKKPIFTQVTYTTSMGEKKKNLLLASGYWGLARHFHYIPELLGAFLWSLPALFFHFYPYFYVTFLFILLVDRSRRDEVRCSEKYGEGWDEHCEKVPYKLIPFIY